MRLRSDFFVAALIRAAETQGAVAMLRRRGSAEAGSVIVKIDRLNGRITLYGGAPQAQALPRGVDRMFSRLHSQEWLDPIEAEERLKREIAFDADVWIVEIEDKAGRAFVDVAD